jgi:hypothetical protein
MAKKRTPDAHTKGRAKQPGLLLAFAKVKERAIVLNG